MTITWSEILADPTLNRVAHRLNQTYLYMGEKDIEYIINQVLNASKIIQERKHD